MAIISYSRGAYEPIMLLADGETTTLSEYRQSGNTTQISSVIRGAYEPLIENSDGNRVGLTDHLRSTGGQLIEKVAAGGYMGLVMDDTAGIGSIANDQIAIQVNSLSALGEAKVEDAEVLEIVDLPVEEKSNGRLK